MTPETAAERFHWIKYLPESNTIELYMDNHMLSGLRTCEAKFQLEHLLNIRPRGIGVSWSLQFGAFLHKCLEHYYNSIKNSPAHEPMDIATFTVLVKHAWRYYNLDHFKGEPKYEKLGGFAGALALLMAYWTYYRDLRVRIIDTEISFGKQKECPIGEFQLIEPYTMCNEGTLRKTCSELSCYTVKCYLTGRIDLLIDNGYKIGPVDHKHTTFFSGNESRVFNPSDGITGYIYAIQCILKDRFPDFTKRSNVGSGWIYHISSTFQDKYSRFKATAIDKNEAQFAEYKLRQLATFKRVCDLVFNDSEPQWNTNNCFQYSRDCEYKGIHERPPESRLEIIQEHYQVVDQWNPAEVAEDYQFLKREHIEVVEEKEPA